MKNECNNNRDYNNNITWHSHKVTRQERWKVNNSSGCAGGAILWFTGLSGSGKSSIANEVDYILNQKRKLSTYILDGDNIRHGLCKDLGFSLNDRRENIRRISEVAKLMFDAGMIVLAAFISPYRSDRDSIRHEIVPMYNNNDNDNDNDNDNNNKVSDFLRSKSSGAGGVVVHNPTAVTTGPASGTIAAAVAAATTTKPAATAITPLAQNDSGYITELRPYDVLFGRGSVSNDHEGNIRFRQLVAKRKGEYLSAKRRQRKAEIAREIVSSVLMDNGRFLKKVEDSSADVWVTADDETMMEKAKQALRQNKHKTSKVDEVVSGVGGSMSNSSPGNSTKKYCMTATDTSCRFVEIYVKASLETCESRDPKGLYEKARQGKIKNFTGIDDPYEEPINAEIVLNSDEKTVEELANEVVSWLERNGIIQYIR